ncbi:hypothetical protein LINPERHAP2_LOCUS35772 [Linum perenne]
MDHLRNRTIRQLQVGLSGMNQVVYLLLSQLTSESALSLVLSCLVRSNVWSLLGIKVVAKSCCNLILSVLSKSFQSQQTWITSTPALWLDLMS